MTSEQYDRMLLEMAYLRYPVGTFIKKIIKELGMTQVELSLRMGRPKKTICEILNNKAHITAETAIQLEYATGMYARWILRWQAEWDLRVARRKYSNDG